MSTQKHCTACGHRVAPPEVPRWLRLYGLLGPLNFLFFQWFGVRLQREVRLVALKGFDPVRSEYEHVRWSLRRWVLPLTGWWSRYIETRGAR